MKAQIVALKTRIKNQKERIGGLNVQLEIVREALDRMMVELAEVKEEITYQKSRVTKRDKKIKELTK